MTEYLIHFFPTLTLAFAVSCFTLLTYFTIGEPRKSAFGPEADNTALLGFIGVRISILFDQYQEGRPDNSFNPLKMFMCTLCLSQWVGLLGFLLAVIFFGFSWKFILAHQGFVFFWTRILDN